MNNPGSNVVEAIVALLLLLALIGAKLPGRSEDDDEDDALLAGLAELGSVQRSMHEASVSLDDGLVVRVSPDPAAPGRMVMWIEMSVDSRFDARVRFHFERGDESAEHAVGAMSGWLDVDGRRVRGRAEELLAAYCQPGQLSDSLLGSDWRLLEVRREAADSTGPASLRVARRVAETTFRTAASPTGVEARSVPVAAAATELAELARSLAALEPRGEADEWFVLFNKAEVGSAERRAILTFLQHNYGDDPSYGLFFRERIAQGSGRQALDAIAALGEPVIDELSAATRGEAVRALAARPGALPGGLGIALLRATSPDDAQAATQPPRLRATMLSLWLHARAQQDGCRQLCAALIADKEFMTVAEAARAANWYSGADVLLDVIDAVGGVWSRTLPAEEPLAVVTDTLLTWTTRDPQAAALHGLDDKARGLVAAPPAIQAKAVRMLRELGDTRDIEKLELIDPPNDDLARRAIAAILERQADLPAAGAMTIVDAEREGDLTLAHDETAGDTDEE